VGLVSLIALPPFGSFWAWLKLTENLSAQYPLLVGVLILVNSLTAFSGTREFCLLFTGAPKPMTVRSPEVLWPMVLPMVITVGFALHGPLILQQWGLLPAWADINLTWTGILVASSTVGVASSAFIYLNPAIPKPIQLPLKQVQDFFAYDLYTAQLYRITIVAVIGAISQLINWFDKIVVDGLVNLVGLATVFGGQALKYNVSGQTQFYVLSIILGITLIGVLISYQFLQPFF
jgi:NAD(P)H-quinone oxidoreductase subunit 5